MEIKASELEKIINACGKNGVSHFKMGDIEINFNGFVKVLETDYPEKVETVQKVAVTDPNFELQEQAEKEIEETEELLILDPVAYEERLLKNELEESDNNLTD